MPELDLLLRRTPDGLAVRLHVQPRAKKNEISGVHNGALKIRVTAPPVDDAANRTVIEYLAERLGIPRSRLSILSGARSRNKSLHIRGMSPENFHKQLGI
jgi:uncharacterized protein (TIGR00251 family)